MSGCDTEIRLSPFAVKNLGLDREAHRQAVERAQFVIFWCIANGLAPEQYRISDAGLLQLADMQSRQSPPSSVEITECRDALREMLEDGTV